MDEIINVIHCPRCGQDKPASSSSPHMCVDCEKVLNNRYSALRNRNDGWMDIAKDSGLEIYERQPKETQLEWTIWQYYRDSYPGAKPSYRDVAAKANTTYAFVKQTAGRWDFQTRLQAWIAECDRITVAQRRQEVLDMNAEHIDMARRLRDKLSAAIDLVDPAMLKPSDLNGLMKTVTELEKKARLDNIDQQVALQEAYNATLDGNENPELKQSPTKSNDLGEVVQILLNAGALGSVTQIGVRETTTTTREVVAAGENGSASIVQED